MSSCPNSGSFVLSVQQTGNKVCSDNGPAIFTLPEKQTHLRAE